MNREFERKPFVRMVTINSQKEKMFQSKTENLSLGGTFVNTEHPLAIGTHGFITFTIDTGNNRKDLNIPFTVSHHNSTDNDAEGMGLKFDDLSEDNSVLMKALISTAN
jgi:Tfp pilus assembly protein PilZ